MTTHKLTALQWSELQSASQHLAQMLTEKNRTVTATQWSELQTMFAHIGGIIGAEPVPSTGLHPSRTLYP